MSSQCFGHSPFFAGCGVGDGAGDSLPPAACMGVAGEGLARFPCVGCTGIGVAGEGFVWGFDFGLAEDPVPGFAAGAEGLAVGPTVAAPVAGIGALPCEGFLRG